IGTKIYYHLGTGKGKFMPDGRLSIKGVSLNPSFLDMNGDGKLDVLTSALRTDLIKHGVDRLMGDVTVTYEVWQFEKSGYSEQPVHSFDIHIPIEDIQKRSGATRPMFQVPGDLSGDGRPDAVIYNPQTSKLEVRKGKVRWAASDRPVIDFEKDVAAEYALDRDNLPKWISYMDMNGDGRQDLLLNYAGQLIILLSRF
ncbi:MAG TPA: VCBS repeat-containing protein, partial [Planctomycetota bacterium]|nr:VCBS repeat-containing protein [Planctomycetota bacterium]